MAKATFTPFAAKVSARLVAEVDHAVFTASGRVAVHASFLITQGSSGGKDRVPSAPGDPPNEHRGGLRSGIFNTPVQDHASEVVSTAPYSRALEYGTSKMAARPFMRRALAETEDDARQIIANAVSKATKG